MQSLHLSMLLLTYKIEQYVPTHEVLLRAKAILCKNHNKHYVLSKRDFNLRLLSKIIKSQKIGTLVCKILSVKKITLNVVFFLSYKKINTVFEFEYFSNNVTVFKNFFPIHFTILFYIEKFPNFSACISFVFKWKELFFQYSKFIIAKTMILLKEYWTKKQKPSLLFCLIQFTLLDKIGIIITIPFTLLIKQLLRRNVSVKKDSLWITGPKFITRVQKPLFTEASQPHCTSGKMQRLSCQDSCTVFLKSEPKLIQKFLELYFDQ